MATVVVAAPCGRIPLSFPKPVCCSSPRQFQLGCCSSPRQFQLGCNLWVDLKKCRGPITLLNATAQVAAEAQRPSSEPVALANKLLSLVEGTNRGVALSKDQQVAVADTIFELERVPNICNPLESPLIFGAWDVKYCSNPTSPGGNYRSAVGRLFFETTEMVQTIRAPDKVGNKLAFTALGILNAEVTLEGNFKALDERWIEVTFKPPTLKIGSMKFQYGSTSKVKISVTYLDERIRLGRGSRGSIFVFEKVNDVVS